MAYCCMKTTVVIHILQRRLIDIMTRDWTSMFLTNNCLTIATHIMACGIKRAGGAEKKAQFLLRCWARISHAYLSLLPFPLVFERQKCLKLHKWREKSGEVGKWDGKKRRENSYKKRNRTMRNFFTFSLHSGCEKSSEWAGEMSNFCRHFMVSGSNLMLVPFIVSFFLCLLCTRPSEIVRVGGDRKKSHEKKKPPTHRRSHQTCSQCEPQP